MSPAIVILLLAGLALRLLIAYVIFPGSGFESDLASYASWAGAMAEHGPAGFYQNVGFADYPPAYLYVLWLVGSLSGPTVSAFDLIKLPPILLDILVGYVIYRLVRGWTWPGVRSESLALAAAALYVFNPVSFYDSALWGQTDAAGALILLLGLSALIRGNSEGAAAFAATAALVKPQFGVVLIPIVAAVLIKRHLLRPASGPRRRPWAPAGLAAWLGAHQGPIRLLTAFGAAWAAFFIIALPFGMGPLEYLERMFGTAGGYGYLSVNAFNGWALIGAGGEASLAEAMRWSDDSVGLIGPIPGLAIGAALLLVGFLWGVVRGAVRDDRWTLIVAVTFLAVAFFILPTRVHERYIFPVIALMPLLAVVSGRWAVALLLLSVGAFINLHAILTLPLYGTENVETLAFGDWFRTQPLIMLSALLQTGVGLWVAAQLRPSLHTSPDAFEEEARQAGAPAPLPQPVAYTAPPVAGPSPGPPSAYPPAAPTLTPPPVAPSFIDHIVARFSWGSLRRDRSALLRFEPGGRIDRLDVVVLIVLVVLSLTLRGFRLDQPVRMYFDEVYHARTATELLQHWEYGEPHDIYEFTHPHLAKYAIAWGIRLAGGNEISSTSELGLPALDTAIERRWAPDEAPDSRAGDWLYVAAGDSLGVYDLATRELVEELPLTAGAVAVDPDEHLLYVADQAGRLYRLDTGWFDAQRDGAGASPAAIAEAATPISFGPGAPVQQLLVTDTALVAVTLSSIASFDPDTGELLSERLAVGIEDVVALPWTERLVIDTRELTEPQATVDLLAQTLDEDPVHLGDLLARDGFVTVAAWLDDETVDSILAHIEDGELPGAMLESAPLLAVADAGGVEVLDAWSLDPLEELRTDEPVMALALAEPGSSEPTLYAATGATLETVRVNDDGLAISETMWMPGAVRDLAWNEPAGLMHVLGDAPAGGPTVYVVEPKGRSVFIDVPLSYEPEHLLADTNAGRPDLDRLELLAIAGDGRVSDIDIGGNAFGSRLPGVLFGALTAALVYLLTRVLFARRSIGLIAAVLVLAEGMLFANARIAMNDVYVTAFVLLAVLSLAPLYLAPRRPWTAAALVLGVGLALGLALASKWVALYAIGGLGLLVLFRSALGRAIALLGMMGLTTVLGTMAIRPDADADVVRNWVFLLLMLVLTGLLAAGMMRRPIPWTRAEVILAVAMPLAAGVALFLLGSPTLGGLALMSGVVLAVVALIATMTGHGPWTMGARLPLPGTSAWLRPGPVHVVPWLLTLAALSVVPVVVYIVTYSPWVELGNDWGLPFFGSLPFLAEGTDGGRSVGNLTESMYQYHDNLRAEHAASSPWWAWPLDLKPVWFFQERYDDQTTGLIYDTGNLVIFWLGIAGMAFSAWAAWYRRSLALTMVVVMWAAMWLPWARVDRAAFQYHVYASLPFMIMALAYFLGELWHGPSWRTWFLARATAALAIVAIPLLWLLRTPLCIISGTAVAHPEGVACASEVTRTAQLSEGGVTALFVVGAGAAMAAFLGWRAARSGANGQGVWVAAMVVVALLTLGGVVAALLLLDTGSTTGMTVTSDVYALVGLVVLAIPALIVLRARDPRRFVLGVLAAACLWLLVWYPNISGLPLPAEFAHLYQGLLPTWNWDFQFSVNTDPASDNGVLQPGIVLVGGVTLMFVMAVALAARRWGGRHVTGP